MSAEIEMIDENILYCLKYLAEFEPSDIEGDDFEIAVNDDQFASMSIVRAAELGADLIERQAAQIAQLKADKILLHGTLTDVFEYFKFADDPDDKPMESAIENVLAATGIK